MQQLEMSLYLKTEVSEIQSQINRIRNFVSNQGVTSEKRRYAQREVQACVDRLFSRERENNDNTKG